MKTSLEIARKELRTLLFSPIGWLMLTVVAMQAGTMLLRGISVRTVQVGNYEGILSLTYHLLFSTFSGLVPQMLQNLYLFIPLITMGLISQEYGKGTIKLLFSSPIKVREIVLGKYLSVMIYGLLLVALFLLLELLIGLFVVQSMDMKVAFWGLLMFYLVVCLYAAVGLFVSSLTSYPFVAALGTVGMLFGLQYVSGLAVVNSMPPMLLSMLKWFSVLTMFENPSFIGYISTWQVLYFPIVIALFLGLTCLRLYSMRQSEPLWRKFRRYIVLTIVVIAIGMASVFLLSDSFFNVRSANPMDTRILIGKAELMSWRSTLMYGIPLIPVILGAVLTARRRWQ